MVLFYYKNNRFEYINILENRVFKMDADETVDDLAKEVTETNQNSSE